MSDETTIPPAAAKPRINGLGPKAQKLQALRDKAAGKAGHQAHGTSNVSAKGSAGFKKTSFQRKAT